MHSEWNNITPVRAYVLAHRARIAVAVGVALALALYVAWEFASAAIHVSSPTLDMCVLALAAVGSAVAALALYWSAE